MKGIEAMGSGECKTKTIEETKQQISAEFTASTRRSPRRPFLLSVIHLPRARLFLRGWMWSSEPCPRLTNRHFPNPYSGDGDNSYDIAFTNET